MNMKLYNNTLPMLSNHSSENKNSHSVVPFPLIHYSSDRTCEEDEVFDNSEKTSSKGESKNKEFYMKTNQKKKRKAFTKEEDELIKKLTTQYGTKQWNLIAEFVKDRTPKQIRDRYFNYLFPGFFSGEWSKEEDELLKELYNKYGPKWTVLQKSLKNRSANTIKNRWDFFLCRQLNKKDCNETTADSESDATLNNEKLSNHIDNKNEEEEDDDSIKTNTDDSTASSINDYINVFEENRGEEPFEFFNYESILEPTNNWYESF